MFTENQNVEIGKRPKGIKVKGIYVAGQWGIVYTANPSIVISLANYWN